MKNGLESAGRALGHGLAGYRVELRRLNLNEILIAVYHAHQAIKLTQRIVTNEQATNPFLLNTVVAAMRVEADTVGLFIEIPLAADCLTA
ncbi:hypothetical protein QE444_002145 [Pseudomonas sp. SORGH_AS199]|uniref:Uncharacterized protein n=1 Tax=Pseudomonas flavocrustae TaxID=2991719 RepID=A0ABT6ID88_9PSED|nr:MULTISPECIES: hypothetical protein [Pseudomonas]MDH4762421.1 hypothetical protein [Pseudomonas sp. CBMAI 2609]MDK8266653.1 hypothetical protein [Pseudomonas oryzihabitans]MDR6229788.1 hypothetical protein [Pseudomonas sp. SORGH_AS_0199]